MCLHSSQVRLVFLTVWMLGREERLSPVRCLNWKVLWQCILILVFRSSLVSVSVLAVEEYFVCTVIY